MGTAAISVAAARPTAEVEVAKVAAESSPLEAPAQVAETALKTAMATMATALDTMAAGREATEKAQAVSSGVTR